MSKTAKVTTNSVHLCAYNIHDCHDKIVLNLQASIINALRTTIDIVLSQKHIFNSDAP